MTTQPRLGGRYEIGELLGSGGMAEVRRGRDVRLGRDVAVKMLRSDLARDVSFQHRFRREAQSAASLEHPSIVAVYDTGEEETADGVQPYIVMEYVEGRTLRDVLREEGRLLPDRALEITAEVLTALDYSHQHGIVHRDIKPGNVMLTPTGTVKVMDFGIARAVAASAATMTQTAAVIGTAQYLSPEQARGDHVDARSDVYSTGCLLFELLTGAPPFTGESPVAVAYQHVREDPVPPSQLDPSIPPAVDAIVLTALAKNPAARYQGAGQMRADIERALAGRPVHAAPVVAPDRAAVAGPIASATAVSLRRPPPRRGRRAVAYTALALAAVAVFAVAVLVAKSLLNTGGSDVNTPNVVGRTLAQAQQALANAGLRTGSVDKQYDAKAPAGQVVKQSPLPDILLQEGDTVDLTVSLGVKIVAVPPLQGLSQQDAVTNLRNADLKVGQIRQADPPEGEPAGRVLSSDPAEGAQVPAGTPVALVVSTGRIQVPDVRHVDEATATSKLQQAGFDVSQQQRPANPGEQPGQVVAQNPPAGSYAERGSTVTIVVATQPEPTTTPSTPASPGSPTPTAPTPSATASPAPTGGTRGLRPAP